MATVLILGSGPSALRARGWPRAPFDRIVAINNAWAIRPDWDELIHPHDFPPSRMPETLGPGQVIVDQSLFVPAQNEFGGFVYAGATMAFTAGYWALSAHRPRIIGFLGCDMHYPATGATHFYGNGTPDPLRADITLQSLEAKAARLMVLAAAQGCAVVNLSDGPSRLVFPRCRPDAIAPADPGHYDAALIQQLREREARLGYFVASGRYWDHLDAFDPAELGALDRLWLKVAGLEGAADRRSGCDSLASAPPPPRKTGGQESAP